MTRLFRRQVALTVARPGAAPNFFTVDGANAIQISELRVAFNVEKKLGGKPNVCTAQVFNLAERTRAEFQARPLYVRLEAGYENDVRRLFTGDLKFGHSEKSGNDWITEMTLGDGARAYSEARVSRSFRSGTKRRAALAELADAMGLDVPSNAAEFAELDVEFASGVALSGSAARELTRIASAAGLDWSIQDGRLQLLREADVRADEAIEISEATGMIGSPEMGPPTKKRKRPLLTVRTLLDPRITPGGRVLVKARSEGGLCKVIRVQHTGDTHGPDWYSTAEAVPL